MDGLICLQINAKIDESIDLLFFGYILSHYTAFHNNVANYGIAV
jgi:hypothetical protein